MNLVTLRQLRYFDAVARFGHFGNAADACAVSQPALSVQIKELENAVGAPLIERTTRHIRLTAFGEEYVKRARDILRSVDELSEFARSAATGIAGPLRLGVIPTIAPYLLPRLFKRLDAAFPSLELNIRETKTPRLISELTAGRIDTAIVALPVSEPNFIEIPLFEEDFVLVRPEQDADKPVPSAETLREMRLLLLEEGHCFRDQALSFCSMPTTRPREMMDGSSLSTLVQMVGAGMGVTLIPEMAVPVETSSAAVSVSHFDMAKPTRTIGMIWRKSNPMSDRLRQIATVVQECQ